MAPSLIGEGSGGPLCGACSLKGQKKDRGQSKERDQKTEDCGEEEEEVGVHLTTLGQGDSRECHSLREH